MFLGDFPEDFTTVTCLFTTHLATGAIVAPLSAFEAADVQIFKNGSATEKTSTNGLTMTSPFNSVTGLHCLVMDTSNDTGDAGFWVAGAQYTAVLVPDETVDGLVVAKVIGTFTLGLVPLVATVAAIKAKTDNLPSDPADQSAVEAAIAALNDLSGAEIADAVLDEAVDGTTTMRESIRLQNAALAGKASGLDTTSVVFRDLADTKNRIAATVDASGNRTAVTLNVT